MLQLALLSTLAFSSQVRLLTAEDAPVAQAGGGGSAAPKLDQTQHNPVVTPLPWGYQMAAGSAAAVIFVPASFYLAQALGSLSNNLIWAALPVLLCIGLVPPLAISAATTLAGNWNAPGHYRFWPALLTTLLINGISLPLAAWGGLSVAFAERVIIYTLAQAVLQPAGATLVQRLFPRQEEQPAVISSRDPNAGPTFFVPLQTASF